MARVDTATVDVVERRRRVVRERADRAGLVRCVDVVDCVEVGVPQPVSTSASATDAASCRARRGMLDSAVDSALNARLQVHVTIPRTLAQERVLAPGAPAFLAIDERSYAMQKRLVTRYAMRSAEAADENQRRVEGVFAELEETKPDSVSYIVLRLADDSFVHVSFHDHGDDEVNPIASTAAFDHFQDGSR